MSWRELSIQLLSGTSMYRELHPTKRQIASQVNKCPPAAFSSPRGRIELNPPDIASRPLIFPGCPEFRFIVSVLTIAFCLNISQLTDNSSLASCHLMVEMIRKET